MMNGPQESETHLIPTAQAGPRGRHSTQSWIFQPSDEKWIMCGYGPAAGGSVVEQIGRRLDDKFTLCTMLRTATAKGADASYSFKCETR